MITPPPLTKLRAHVRVSGQELTLQVPAWHWAWRGLVLALAVPPLIALLAVLVAFATAKGGPAVPSPVLAGAAAMTFFFGLGLALISPLVSRRTRVVVDLERREIAGRVPLEALTGVHVARGAIWATRAGAADLRLLGPLSEGQLAEAKILAEWLAQTLSTIA